MLFFDRLLPAGAVAAVLLAGCSAEASPPPPDPAAGSVVAHRKAAANRARAAVDGVVSAAGGRLLGRAWHDVCYAGQNNWKVHDGYAYRCTRREVAAFGFRGDFRRRIARLDARLFRSGWKQPCTGCGSETLSSLVEEYWDLRVGEATPERPFSISWLPTPSGYERGDLMLTFDFGDRNADGRYTLARADWIPQATLDSTYELSRPLDVDATLARAGNDHVLVAAIDADYFEN